MGCSSRYPPRLAKDLGSEFLPIYPTMLKSAVHVTTTTKDTTNGDERAAANLVERAFQSSAWILKAVSPFVVSKEKGASVQDDALNESAEDGDIVMVEEDVEEDEVDERTQRLIDTWTVIRPTSAGSASM